MEVYEKILEYSKSNDLNEQEKLALMYLCGEAKIILSWIHNLPEGRRTEYDKMINDARKNLLTPNW